MSRRSAGLIRSLVLSAALAPAFGFAVAAHAAPPGGPTPPDGYNATINQGNVPTTAAAYSQDCNPDEFGNKPASSDGWLFVASPSNFKKLQAQFNDSDVITFDGTNSTQAYYTKVGDHVAVITPGGWTLKQAFAELDGDKDFFTLSHTCAATQPQQPATSPSATKSHESCTNVTFGLSAGSSDATFVIQRTGESTTTSVPVSANQTVQHDVALDADHPGATVTANGSPVASYTRPDSCNDNNNGGGGDNNGDTGGTTTGGGTAEGGSISGVTGSTGAPGGATTSVLGEKLTKTPGSTSHTPTGVEATHVATLPMTGYAATHAVELGGLLCLVGFGAIVAGRRRAPKHRYIQVRN